MPALRRENRGSWSRDDASQVIDGQEHREEDRDQAGRLENQNRKRKDDEEECKTVVNSLNQRGQEIRNRMIKVRVTWWEEAKLKALAIADGLSLSEYLRRCGLKKIARRRR